ncbi:hypothetical protein BKA69DRAFT_1096082 [Paraphysoderma sedebokerense]|nr:hypothetical protein BKA69DRAFT_1096018 [Paraphysoderma sedebokerense]KAI9137765.1 hypothetical protein BKA69DRAFT_1096082 [Paraphysoderma sedebokerense]
MLYLCVCSVLTFCSEMRANSIVPVDLLNSTKSWYDVVGCIHWKFSGHIFPRLTLFDYRESYFPCQINILGWVNLTTRDTSAWNSIRC